MNFLVVFNWCKDSLPCTYIYSAQGQWGYFGPARDLIINYADSGGHTYMVSALFCVENHLEEVCRQRK